MFIKLSSFDSRSDVVVAVDQISRFMPKDDYRPNDYAVVFLKDGIRISVTQSVENICELINNAGN